MSTDHCIKKTFDRLMARADAYGRACHECRGSPEGSPDTTSTRATLRAAITEALDLGEPVAYAEYDKDDGLIGTSIEHDESSPFRQVPLYAPKDRT